MSKDLQRCNLKNVFFDFGHQNNDYNGEDRSISSSYEPSK